MKNYCSKEDGNNSEFNDFCLIVYSDFKPHENKRLIYSVFYDIFTANSNLGFAVIRKDTLYCIIKTFAEMRRSFLYAMDPIVVFMGISKKMHGIDK